MEPGGGTSGMKPVDVDLERFELHDTDSSELSVLIASVSTLPHLEATDTERVLNEEEKKKRREERKLKREERKKKKEKHRLEEKKARKEERNSREKLEEKEQEAKASNASSSELSSSSEDGDDSESYQVHSKKGKKGKGKKDNDNKYTVISFNYSSMSMTNHDRKSFINVPVGKLSHFDGTNFTK
jgi:hypothetical protein